MGYGIEDARKAAKGLCAVLGTVVVAIGTACVEGYRGNKRKGYNNAIENIERKINDYEGRFLGKWRYRNEIERLNNQKMEHQKGYQKYGGKKI